MELSFLNIFDLFRFMFGAVTAELVFIVHSVPQKNKFTLRVFGGLGVCVCWMFTYFPLTYVAGNLISNKMVESALMCLWWFISSLVSLTFIYFCYEISISNLLFRGSMGLALQEIITVLLQYCVVKMWFPTMMDTHTILYITVTVAMYVLGEGLAYLILAKHMQDKGRTVIMNNIKNTEIFFVILAGLSLCTNFTSGVFEWSRGTEGLSWNDIEYFNKTVVPAYCVFILLVVCIIIILNQYSTYVGIYQKQENDFLKQLEKEKAQQYEFSRENIDIINQKCHDLKYQISALRSAVGAEREKIFDETKRAIQFYDSVIRTDNRVLDTILTEKSLICSKYNIRLSCNVKTSQLDRFDIIDLYTMLGNALDNAIECVKKYDNTEKRVISFSIRENGEMIHIFVDNYFEGELKIRDGFPITEKRNQHYHGFGIKSINMIAKKYEGDSMVSVNNNTFSLHIMIPQE